jgi:hypothetical protein
MYKSRLKQWGLRKNYRYDEVSEIIRQQGHRSAVVKPTASDSALMRARKADDKRIRAYRRRQPSNIITTKGTSPLISAQQLMTPPSTTSTVSCRAPSTPGGPSVSFLFPLTPPEDLKAPEECGYHVHNYFANAFEEGMWQLQNPDWLPSNRRIVDWYNRVALARGTLSGGHTKKAFGILQTIFDEYKELLTTQDPRLILYTWTAMAILSEFPEIANVLLKYMYNLSRVVHPSSHPLHQVLSQLYHMGLTKTMENARHLFECQIAMFQKYLPPDNLFLSSVSVFSTKTLVVAGLMDTEAAETALLSLPPVEDHTNRIPMALAHIYGVGNQYEKARRIINDLLETKLENPRTIAGAYDTLFYICFQEDNDEQIRSASHRRISFCLEAFGPSNEWTVDAASDLANHLRKVGDIEAADAVFSNYGVQELSEAISELQIG